MSKTIGRIIYVGSAFLAAPVDLHIQVIRSMSAGQPFRAALARALIEGALLYGVPVLWTASFFRLMIQRRRRTSVHHTTLLSVHTLFLVPLVWIFDRWFSGHGYLSETLVPAEVLTYVGMCALAAWAHIYAHSASREPRAVVRFLRLRRAAAFCKYMWCRMIQSVPRDYVWHSLAERRRPRVVFAVWPTQRIYTSSIVAPLSRPVTRVRARSFSEWLATLDDLGQLPPLLRGR